MNEAKIGSTVLYFPNEQDNVSKPRNEGVPAIVVAKGEKVLPSEKDEKGNVTETKTVATAVLIVFQNNADAPFIHREVVHRYEAEDTKLNYKLSYWTELV